MFKNLILGLAVAVVGLALAREAQADHFVRGHNTYYGSYVQPHFRSNPDGNFYNNYSTFPNINPYTGSIGTHRYPSYSHPAYHYTPHRASGLRGF